MSVQWTITVRHQSMEILKGERGKKHSSLRLWLLCFCSCILSLLQLLLGPFSFVIFLSRQIKGPGDTKWHAKSDTGKEMCKRWWICSLENDREKNSNVFMPYSTSSKPGHELFLVDHRILHGISGFSWHLGLGNICSKLLQVVRLSAWLLTFPVNAARIFFFNYYFFFLCLSFFCHVLSATAHLSPLPLPSFCFYFFSFLERRSLPATGGRVCSENQLVWSW